MVFGMAIPPPPPPPLPQDEEPGFWKRVIAPPPPEPGRPRDFTRDFEDWLDDHRMAKIAVYFAGVVVAFVAAVIALALGSTLIRALLGWLPDMF